jgi:hypothetical protein
MTTADNKKALLERTTDSDWSVREQACAALGPLAKDDAEIRKALLERTTDSDGDVREQAFAALGPLAKDDAEIRKALNDALADVRTDVFEVMGKSPLEVPALRLALKAGNVDGSTYNGECGCLLATLATARGLRYDKIPGLEPNSARPSERFYLLISKGDTPETSWAAAMADQWAAEFEVENSAK